MSDDPQARFAELWARTIGTGADAPWWALDDGYGAAARRYHGWGHVADLLAGHDAVRALPDFADLDGDALGLALYFHDAVYDVGCTDNEARSADLLAAHAGPAAGTPRLRAADAHGSSADLATCLMLDLDLAILGAPPPVYTAYAAAIRQEYETVPEAAWRIGHAGVLDSFLARPHLYQTDHFRDPLEAEARRNLSAEMEALRVVASDAGP